MGAMSGDSLDARKIFADQFEPDGDGFLYRKSGRGAPIRVTAAERDQFIDDFNRRFRYMVWGSAGATMAAIVLLLAFEAELTPIFNGYEIVIAPVLGVLVILIANQKVYGAPARELEHRHPVGFERSRDEVRRRALAKVNWAFLAVTAMGGVVYFASHVPKSGFDSGWGAMWIAGAVFYFVAMIGAAYWKWRYGRTADD